MGVKRIDTRLPEELTEQSPDPACTGGPNPRTGRLVPARLRREQPELIATRTHARTASAPVRVAVRVPARVPVRVSVRVRRAPLLAAAACAALALTGCSSGSGSGSGGGTSTPATATSASSSATGSGGGADTIVIQNFAFGPASLTVAPGAKVTVMNKDSTAHTATAVKNKAFDTGTIAPGRTATFTAPKTKGVYDYICTIHQFMKGTLTVS